MRHVLSVVFGAVFTAAAGWALGRVLFHKLGLRLHKREQVLLESITGASLLSPLVFTLCSIGLARTETFFILGALSIFTAFRAGVPAFRQTIPAPLPRELTAIFWFGFAVYATLYLSNSLAPEVSPDGVAYHLGLVARYYRQHGFQRLTTNMYGNLTQGMEMLFLFAFAFGRHSAAATVHCFFLLSSPFLLRSFGERVGRPRAGLCAGMIFFLSPLAGIDGVSAYNDVALAVTGFAMFYLLEVWREQEEDVLLIPVGLLAGFCFAIKYTGFIAIVYAMVVILWNRRSWKPLVPVIGASSLLVMPWLVKNWITVGNPVSPFLSAVFRSPYIHVSFERDYTQYFRSYGLPSLKPLFWIVTVDGRLGGALGPLFLLTPVALLALRTSLGRRCLFAMAFFLVPYPNNIGARFLLPVAPFAALGIALALDFGVIVPAVLILAAAVLAWPRIIPRYSAPGGGWSIASMPWKEALRIRDSDDFLFRKIPHILIARELDEKVPDGGRVWTSTPVAEAYTKRDILVNYQSAEGQLIQDILFCAHFPDLSPTWNLRMTFAPLKAQRIRIRQKATSREDIWSIGELRIFHDGRLTLPGTAWKFRAKPNPWDAELVADGNSATRWRSWESIQPWMYFEIDFGAPLDLDRIELHGSHDQYMVDVSPEICDASGCKSISAKLDKLEDPALPDLRHAATKAIRSRGIRYLLIEHADLLSNDIYPDPGRWGLRLLADRNRTRLYEIQ